MTSSPTTGGPAKRPAPIPCDDFPVSSQQAGGWGAQRYAAGAPQQGGRMVFRTGRGLGGCQNWVLEDRKVRRIGHGPGQVSQGPSLARDAYQTCGLRQHGVGTNKPDSVPDLSQKRTGCTRFHPANDGGGPREFARPIEGKGHHKSRGHAVWPPGAPCCRLWPTSFRVEPWTQYDTNRT